MNTFRLWSPPVTISLLLHATVIVLLTNHLNTSSPEIKSVQTITVEMLGATPVSESKPRLQKPAPVITANPVQEPIKIEQPAVSNEPIPAPVTTEQNSTSEPSSAQSSLNIQPLSKLTRPPAFLRKIEPVYPKAEQRAGSQAYVLAEITIDEQGNVLEVSIKKSAGTAFDNAVTDALKKSMFVPGYIGKDAVAVRVLVPFRFNLK